MLRERSEDPDEPEFDWDVEVAALEAAGYAFPLPIVARALALGRMVSNLGWEATRELAVGTWRGWQATFLVDALVVIVETERRATLLAQAASWLPASPRSSANGDG